jgi:hypothetical protein
MPLSEDDQRRLEWIERALRAGGPLSAAAAVHGHQRRHRLTEAAAVFRLGVIVLLLGVARGAGRPGGGCAGRYRRVRGDGDRRGGLGPRSTRRVNPPP